MISFTLLAMMLSIGHADSSNEVPLTAANDEMAVNLDDVTMLANNASPVDDFLEEEMDAKAANSDGWTRRRRAAARPLGSARTMAPTPKAQETCNPPKHFRGHKGLMNNDC